MAKTSSLLKKSPKGGLSPQKENCKGLYGRLGDKAIPVPKRLKLLRYVWRTHQVNLANKHQTLLHWFHNALHAKSPIKHEDKPCVWNGLHEILATAHLLKDRLYFKPAFAQVVLDELGRIHEGTNKTQRGEVFGCCLIILNTPGLDRLFLSQYETLIQLVAAVTQICIKSARKNDLDSDCEELFSTVVRLFSENQMMKTNAVQNLQQFTTKLLPVVVEIFQLPSEQNGRFSTAVELLKEVSFKILCARDLLQYYESYLRLKTPFNESVYSPPKFIESVFSQLTKSASSSPQRECVLHFVPQFLEAFMKSYRPGENPVGFYHLVLLSDLLDAENHPDALDALRDLLKVVQGQGIYNVTSDIESGDKHIAWLKEVAKMLIAIHPQHRNDASWYECFDWLLRISHSSVEGKVSALLTACLKSSQEDISPECKRAQTELLCRVASIYGQLRQPNKLLIAILNSLDQISDPRFTWPSEFVTALLGTLCCPPLMSGVQLWQNMLARINDLDKVCFKSSVQLLSEFLLTMPLTDPSLTPNVAKKIAELMIETRDQVITPLIGRFKESTKDVKCSTLHLVLAWEKVMFLLCQTSNVQLTLIELSAISKTVDSSKCETLQYLWKLLLIGRVRAETLFSFQNPESRLWNVSDVLSSTLTGSASGASPWNFQILGINERTHSTAMLDLILGHLPLIEDSFDRAQWTAVAQFLCGAVENAVTAKVDGSSMDSKDLALKFLRSPEFDEVFKLHGPFLSLLWLRVGDALSGSGNDPKPKKKRKSGHLNVFMRLSEVASKTHSSDSEELLESWKGTCEEISSMKKTGVNKTPSEVIKRYLEFGIQSLPLEYLKLPDLLSCAVGVMALMLQGSPSEVALCIDVLLRLTENAQFTKVLDLFDSSSFVEMFLPFFEEKVAGFKQLMNRLTRQICQNPENAEQLGPVVEKLCEEVPKLKLSSSNIAKPECFIVLLKSFIKSYQGKHPDEAKKLCKALAEKMSPVAEILVRKCVTEGLDYAELCMETMSTIVILKKPKVNKLKEGKEADSSKGIFEVLPDIRQISVEFLKSSGYSNICADFIDKLCDKKAALEVTDDYLEEVLSALVGNLKGNEGDNKDKTSVLELIVIILMAKSNVQTTFQDILDKLIPTPGDEWMHSAVVSLQIWQYLSTRHLPEAMTELFVASSQQLMRQTQEMLLAVKDFPQTPLVWKLQLATLQTEKVLLSNYGGLFPRQCVVLVFHGCNYVDLDMELKPALDLMSAVLEILNTLIYTFPHIVFNCVPTFLATMGRLLHSLLSHSHQNSVAAQDVELLLACCQEFERLSDHIKANSTDFSRAVPYLIAEYVQGLQKGTIHPDVKKCLSSAIHKLISICDEHSIALLHTAIAPGQRDIFSSLYQEYKKYYKYTGKV